jgi:monovalent cation:H+ antiporter-2, CPA2 family
MVIDTPFVLRHWSAVLGLVLLAVKGVPLWGMTRVAGLGAPTALRVGLLLSQCGEFAFVIFGIARQIGVLDRDAAEILVVTVALTMATTPAMAALGRKLAQFVETRVAPEAEGLAEETADVLGHVIIAGFGHIGQIVAQTLTAQQKLRLEGDLSPAENPTLLAVWRSPA